MRAIDKSSEFGKWLKMKEPDSLEKFYKKADEFMCLESLRAPVKVALTEVTDNTAAPIKKEFGSQKRENNGGKKQKDVKKPRFLKP